MKFFKKSDRCFVIAEVSANHAQDINKAISMIKQAKRCGADAVKFQAYTPEALTIDSNKSYFKIRHTKWKGQTLYELYKKAATPLSWFKKLKNFADSEGIIFFATAFDITTVDMLEDIDVPLHKIASFELVDIPLIKYIASKKKPLILSTGMATIGEIRKAISAARKSGAKDITLLKCVSSYPSLPEDMNLKSIPDMQKKLGLPVGLSDHTLSLGVPVAAVALGARVIEKHFTLSRKIKTPDSFFSIEPSELKTLIQNIREAEKAIGKVHYGLMKHEAASRIFRRSLFAIRDIKKGEAFNQENVRSVRPSYGLPPLYQETLFKKIAKRSIKKGTPINKQDI